MLPYDIFHTCSLLFIAAWIQIFILLLWFSSPLSFTLNIRIISLFNLAFDTSFSLLPFMLKTSPQGIHLQNESHHVTAILQVLSYFSNDYKKESQFLYSSQNSAISSFTFCKCHLLFLKPMKSVLQSFHILCSSILECHAYLSPCNFIYAKSSLVKTLPQDSCQFRWAYVLMLLNNSSFMFSKKLCFSYISLFVPFVLLSHTNPDIECRSSTSFIFMPPSNHSHRHLCV